MTQDINSLIAQATAAAADLEDQTKVQSGDFEFEIAPKGKTPARFVGYVEMGVRKQKPYQGKDKPDCEEVRLYFELNGPKHQRKVVVEGVEQTFTNIISIKLTKKLNDKAGFTKLFNKMVYGRDSIKHMAQLLGEGFLIDIVHNEVEAQGDKPKRTFANMKDKDGNYLIGAPMYQTDPLDDSTLQPIPVPAPTAPIKLLLWNAPSTEQWASIFVDGTRTVKNEKGEEHEVSKNWLQEDIVQNAVNFEGSPLQGILGGVGDLNLDLNPDQPTAPGAPAGEPVASEAPTAPAETEKAPTAPSPAAGAADADVMASLGL